MYFEIDTSELGGAVTGLSECMNTLRGAMRALDQCRADLGVAMNEHPQVLHSLDNASYSSARLSAMMAEYADTLETVIRLYDRAEDYAFNAGHQARLDVAVPASWTQGGKSQRESGSPEFGLAEFSLGPKLYRGAREGPLKLAEELFTAATRPLG